MIGARARTTRLVLVVGMLGVVGVIVPRPATAQPPDVLINEGFTGATAEGFEGVGAACLTGAPVDATPPQAGSHPLAGCPPLPPQAVPQPPTDAAPQGFLQLTNAESYRAGSVLSTTPVPASAGIDVVFDQWQYGGTDSQGGADGISFFLTDGAATLDTSGAVGGALGYAQGVGRPGISHGYLGIGLDAWGNFFNDADGKGRGCAQTAPPGTSLTQGRNMITVRGPGNDVTGYCFLTATTDNFTSTGPWTSTLPGPLRGPLLTLPPGTSPNDAVAALEPSRRRVGIRITPAPNPQVTVAVNFLDGAGPRVVLSFPAPQPVPDTYKFGYSAGTGRVTDVHLIRNLLIQPIGPLPLLNLVKQVRLDPAPPAVYHAGDQVRYQYTVTNSSAEVLSGLVVTDPDVPAVTCDETALAGMHSTVCSGTHTVTADDVVAGQVTNVAVARAIGPQQGPVESPPDTVTVSTGGVTGLALTMATDTRTRYRSGQNVPITYTVTNLSATIATGTTIVDDRVDNAMCEQTTLQPAGTPGDRTLCRGGYLVTDADIRAGSATNGAVARANAGALRSNSATLTVPVTAELAATGIGAFELAATGVPIGVLALAGLTLVALGGTLHVAARRPQDPYRRGRRRPSRDGHGKR